MQTKFSDFLIEHKNLFSKLERLSSDIIRASEIIVNTLKAGSKILICGNGGSAADAQHFAAEIVGKFEKERKALPAIALSTNTSILTAMGNDYGFNMIFARQIEGISSAGDVLIAISTSGNSKNIIYAVEEAKRNELKTIGLLGNFGGQIVNKCDISVIVPHSVTARIQEAHIFILHFWASCIEQQLFNND